VECRIRKTDESDPTAKNFVAEGVTPIPGRKVLVVDDLKEMVLVATEE
jgi:hypothetical protein